MRKLILAGIWITTVALIVFIENNPLRMLILFIGIMVFGICSGDSTFDEYKPEVGTTSN